MSLEVNFDTDSDGDINLNFLVPTATLKYKKLKN